MKRILFIFILLFVSSSVLHKGIQSIGFAPMVASSSNGSPKQALYLSTDNTTPFPVSIYNNNTVIGTVTINKKSADI